MIVNSPNNPTGRIYPVETLKGLASLLDEASERNGRRLPRLGRAVQPDRLRRRPLRSPLEFYPYAFLAYSYGKTLLSPGQRIGYLALPPHMPDKPAVRSAIETVQIAGGWLFPNAVMQYALPQLEELAFDIELFQQKRDLMVGALREIGYRVHSPRAPSTSSRVAPAGRHGLRTAAR